MDVDKRGRGRGRGSRGNRGRGRGGGRGRGRGKKVAAAVVTSEEETSLDQSFDGNSNAAIEEVEITATVVNNATPIEAGEDVSIQDVNKENLTEPTVIVEAANDINSIEEVKTKAANDQQQSAAAIQQTIDMEADISQLEAPTFTTISRGPPEPMLRLKWNHKVNLIGEKVINPMIHNCDQCGKPILVYGRMIPCKHVFCLKCARSEPIKTCPRCNDKVVRVEQSGLGTVFMCTHGGSRYGNTGCRRTYLSQRDLQAHINHRHVTQPPPQPIPQITIPPANDIKTEVPLDVHKPSVNSQRKLSESTASATIQAPSTLLTQRSRTSSNINSLSNSGSGNTNTPSQSSHSALTQANLARINNANAQECHQGKVALHHTLKKTPITQAHNQPPESVADASYYSSVLNSFGSSVSGNNTSSNNTTVNSNTAAAVGYGFESPSQPKQTSQNYQYYR